MQSASNCNFQFLGCLFLFCWISVLMQFKKFHSWYSNFCFIQLDFIRYLLQSTAEVQALGLAVHLWKKQRNQRKIFIYYLKLEISSVTEPCYHLELKHGLYSWMCLTSTLAGGRDGRDVFSWFLKVLKLCLCCCKYRFRI